LERFDAIVVGAGPAGSTTAYRLARAGARVLVLERARFPRDKPCGGGLTERALRQLPFSVDPVVEETVDTLEARLRYGPRFERRGGSRLAVMTQRHRLDAYLAEQAAAAGAELREGARVTAVEGATVRVGDETLAGEVLIGADGVNGIVGRALGLGRDHQHGVALEGNVSYADVDAGRYARRLVLEFGVVPGGYGWVFPKGDHVNVGVGGWEREGPTLRAELARLCEEHAIDPDALTDLRGYRLPMRRPSAVLARGRVALVGDAAGLVEPLTGDGIYEAFLSAKLVTDAALAVLDGSEAGLEPYAARLTRTLAPLVSAGWGAKVALDRFPWLMFSIARLRPLWPVVEKLVSGELRGPSDARGLGRAPVRLLAALAHRAGDPGRPYRAQALTG
jgi:geranylgeranyl reductase family protein